MAERVAIVGAGVSGLTCGVVLAERGFHTAIFAKEIGQQTTSGAAAAIWFPYDAQPAEKVIPWALETYKALIDLTRDPGSGVSMIDLRQFSRTGEIQIPDWAIPLGAAAVATGLRPVRKKKLYDRKDGPQGRGYRTMRNPPRKRVLRRRAARVVAAELNSLSQGQFTGKIDRVGLTPHVALPAITATLAAATGLFFTAERSADFCATRASIYVGNSAIAPDRAHEFFRFAHVVGENR